MVFKLNSDLSTLFWSTYIGENEPDIALGLRLDDYNNVWVGTYDQGIVKFDGETFEYFTEEQGLCNNMVMTVIKDQHSNIWVGTDHGLSVIENNRADLDTHNIRNFSYVDGLKALDINTTSGFADSKNNMWFPSGKGVITINADFVNFKYKEPVVQLNNVNVADEYLDYRDSKTQVKYTADLEALILPYPLFHRPEE